MKTPWCIQKRLRVRIHVTVLSGRKEQLFIIFWTLSCKSASVFKLLARDECKDWKALVNVIADYSKWLSVVKVKLQFTLETPKP